MKRTLAGVIAAVALVATVGLTGPAAIAKSTLKSSGSSFANNIMQACKTHYSGADLTYKSAGSGTGRSEFASKATDFGMTDGPYAAGTQPANFVYIPLVGGPVAMAYNVKGVKSLNLDADTIAKIYTGKITKWNDAQITKLNKGVKLPAATIQPVYRSDSSGTSQNFTQYLGQLVGGVWKSVSVFNTIPGVVGTSAAQGSGVATAVKNTANSIGYADLSDVVANKLTSAAVKNGVGQFVKPDVRSASAFLGAQNLGKDGQLRFDYKAQVRGGYAISLIAYAIARKDGNKDVKGWLTDFVTSCSPTESAKIQYVPLTGAIKNKALDLIDQIG